MTIKKQKMLIILLHWRQKWKWARISSSGAGEQQEPPEQKHQQQEEGQHELPYQLTHCYNNAFSVFEREFDEWMQHEYNHHHLLFEEQQQEA